jgi:hypothetical protein
VCVSVVGLGQPWSHSGEQAEEWLFTLCSTQLMRPDARSKSVGGAISTTSAVGIFQDAWGKEGWSVCRNLQRAPGELMGGFNEAEAGAIAMNNTGWTPFITMGGPVSCC